MGLMRYSRRIQIACLVSLILHLLFMWATGIHFGMDQIGLAAAERTVTLNLRPDSVKRFVDSGRPSEEAVTEAELIAEHSSKASDRAPALGERTAPAFDDPSEFDELAGPHAAEQQGAAPLASATPLNGAQETREEPKTESSDALEDSEKQIVEEALAIAKAPTDRRKPDEKAKRLESAKQETPSEPAADHKPPMPAPPLREGDSNQNELIPLRPGQTRGRAEGGVKNIGFVGFEAMKDELAPYLKVLRNRVERRWQTAIVMRYSGTTPTQAVVDCAIRPDGTLAFAAVVEPGSSASFAPLCQQAIRNAAPFPPFPFEVPEIYRNENLEIRWTFSFLK